MSRHNSNSQRWLNIGIRGGQYCLFKDWPPSSPHKCYVRLFFKYMYDVCQDLVHIPSDWPTPPPAASQQSLDPPLVTAINICTKQGCHFCDIIIQGLWTKLKDLAKRVTTLWY